MKIPNWLTWVLAAVAVLVLWPWLDDDREEAP